MRTFFNTRNHPVQISLKNNSISVPANTKFNLTKEESNVSDIRRYLNNGWIKEIKSTTLGVGNIEPEEIKPVVEKIKPKNNIEIEVSVENINENIDDKDETINNNTEELIDKEGGTDDLLPEKLENDLDDLVFGDYEPDNYNDLGSTDDPVDKNLNEPEELEQDEEEILESDDFMDLDK